MTLEKNGGLWVGLVSWCRFSSILCLMERTSAADRLPFKESSADTWPSLKKLATALAQL